MEIFPWGPQQAWAMSPKYKCVEDSPTFCTLDLRSPLARATLPVSAYSLWPRNITSALWLLSLSLATGSTFLEFTTLKASQLESTSRQAKSVVSVNSADTRLLYVSLSLGSLCLAFSVGSQGPHLGLVWKAFYWLNYLPSLHLLFFTYLEGRKSVCPRVFYTPCSLPHYAQGSCSHLL